MKSTILAVLAAFSFGMVAEGGQKPSARDLTDQARQAFKDGQHKKALELATRAIKLAPNQLEGYTFRAEIHSAERQYKLAVADYTAAIALAPRQSGLYQLRGLEHFKAGQINESIADFDRYLADNPGRKAQHWQRGISYYYAKKFKEGKEQFEGYQTFDSNDVENAVWRYLCMAPLTGTDKARKDILKIGDDRRVPMRQVYDLFAGKLQPKDVLATAKAGKPAPVDLNRRLFYAHLYLGLFYEIEGKPQKALEHLQIAVKHPIGHYMWDVARVHRDLLLQKK